MAKKALLVGINDYSPAGAGGPDLNGCVNDVKDMAHTLNALSIVPATPGAMRILTDRRATRAAIMDGLQWLITGAKRGDTLVFHYSGHGSQMADVSGDEIDGKDETICPHDFAAKGMIRDDDLLAAFRAIPAGVNLDVILDSCHSGTGTRELDAIASMPQEQQVSYRYIPPPLDYGFFIDSDPQIPTRGLLKARSGGDRDPVVVAGINHVLWAGCRSNQTSAETSLGGLVRGVFTYNFCRVLRRAGPGITRKRLDALVCADIRAGGFSQVPQLEASAVSMGERVFC
jgi:metacaspase-1